MVQLLRFSLGDLAWSNMDVLVWLECSGLVTTLVGLDGIEGSVLDQARSAYLSIRGLVMVLKIRARWFYYADGTKETERNNPLGPRWEPDVHIQLRDSAEGA